MSPRKYFILLLILLVPVLSVAEENLDLSVLHQIRSEALSPQNSKVMEHVFYLTDVYGPRLAGSPEYKAAADWSVRQLKEYGLSNVHQEKWAPFGRGWAFSYYSGHLIEPVYQPIIAIPLAWTAGTKGTLTAPATLAIIQTSADLPKYKGKLKDKIVLMSPPRELQMSSAPLSARHSDSDLSELSMFPVGGAGRGGRPGQPAMTPEEARKFRAELAAYWREEGPAMVVQCSANGFGGMVFGGGADREIKDHPPTVVMAAEHYNRIARLLQHEPAVPVKLQFKVIAESYDEHANSVNVISEIPGGAKKDEIVMVGGHLDSWHYATGATDNAVGAAVGIEVMRILKALNLKMDRTVRLALWDAEEEGLLGSKAYVKEHFADPAVMKPTAEHAQLAAYFNIDNGSGKIRGIYTQGNEMVVPIFQKWLEPFRDLGATTVTARNTGGTDHQSFDAVGLPGFQFIQDWLEYMTVTHHSNMDVYDRVQRGDVMQMAAIEAWFVYNAATRPEKLPRKTLPKPQAPPSRGTN